MRDGSIGASMAFELLKIEFGDKADDIGECDDDCDEVDAQR